MLPGIVPRLWNIPAPGLLASLSRHGFLLCPLFHVLLLFVPLGSPFIKKPATPNRALRARLDGRVASFFSLPSHLLPPLETEQFGGFVMILVIISNFILSNIYFTFNVYSFAFYLEPKDHFL